MDKTLMNEKSSRCRIIMTVGTSLFLHKSNQSKNDCLNEPYIKFLNEEMRRLRSESSSIIEKITDRLYDKLIKKDKLDCMLERREKRDPERPDLLPQELSYLAILNKSADIYLLASDSPRGKACARIVKAILDKDDDDLPLQLRDYKVKDLRIVTGLTVEANGNESDSLYGGDFENLGIPNLIQEIIACEKGAEESQTPIIINFTGGFKGAIPYTVLTAYFLKQRDVAFHYLFESSKDIIKLPLYPIGLDFTCWHNENALLQAYLKNKNETYLDLLDPRMKAIANAISEKNDHETDSESNSQFESLPELLQNSYRSQRDQDPLQYYSKRVIDHFLPPEKAPDFNNRLTALIENVGPFIWLGDKLPMAADHSDRHHHDLLALAQVFLAPIADEPCGEKATFLSTEERFVLLAALLLHDSGHTLDRLPLRTAGDDVQDIPLLRSEIRDYHHFLTYYRLTRLTENKKPPLGWDSTKELAELVAWLCVYHRRKTGWGEEKTTRCPYLNMTIGTPLHPHDELIQCLEKHSDTVDFKKLVVLLRLIDGCDNQHHRIGSDTYRELYEQSLTYDKETYELRLKRLLSNHPQSTASLPEKAKVFLEEVNDNYAKSKNICTDFREELVKTIAKNDAGIEPPLKVDEYSAYIYCDEVVMLYDEYSIRDRQTIHFAKHQVVESIQILPSSEFDKEKFWDFDVLLTATKNTEKNLLDCKSYFEEYGDTSKDILSLREWIENEVISEIKLNGEKTSPMVDYLHNQSGRRIRFNFRWDGSESHFDSIENISSRTP